MEKQGIKQVCFLNLINNFNVSPRLYDHIHFHHPCRQKHHLHQVHHFFLELFEFFSCHSLLFHAFSPALLRPSFYSLSSLGDASSTKTLPDDGRPLSTVRPSDQEVEDLFEKMLTRRGIHDLGARSVMLSFSADKKWLMVSQDKQADATVTVRPTASISASSKKAASESKELDKGTPEYYIKQFLEPDFRGINPKILAHLAVSLRTMPLRYV